LKRSTEPILATHAGRLPTPPDLSSEAPDFAARLRAVVVDGVRGQAEIGIDVVNDGELSRGNWRVYAAGRLSGFEPQRMDARSRGH
jgi:5-methyltetrahydropteroyltriglutamate--homocysteine methyltransferase